MIPASGRFRTVWLGSVHLTCPPEGAQAFLDHQQIWAQTRRPGGHVVYSWQVGDPVSSFTGRESLREIDQSNQRPEILRMIRLEPMTC